MLGVAALVSLAFAAWTLFDLARNFHDDAAVRLLPDLFRWLGVAGVFATVWRALRRGPSQPVGLWVTWLVGACAGVVVFFVGAYLLARPLDLGRYEAYCQPLLVESIPGSENPERCADGGRLALGLLLVGLGVSIWIGRSRALSHAR
jgi:peptidoglycan/LPS O-acetylase OafA/YrhL